MLEITSLGRLTGALDAVIAPASRGWVRGDEGRGMGLLLDRMGISLRRDATSLAAAPGDAQAMAAAERLRLAVGHVETAAAGIAARTPLAGHRLVRRFGFDDGVVPALTAARDAVAAASEITKRMPNVGPPAIRDARAGAELLRPSAAPLDAGEQAIVDGSANGFAKVMQVAQALGAQRLLGVRVEGAHHVPADGAFILAPVHGGQSDILLQFLGHRRALRTMGAHDMFEKPGVAGALRAMGIYPVRRGDSETAMRATEAMLAAGQPVSMFPEGLRSNVDANSEARRGVALLALRTGTSIVPMGSWGTRPAYVYGRSVLSRMFDRPHAVIVYGEAIRVDGIAPTAENVIALTHRLDEANHRLSEQARRVALGTS